MRTLAIETASEACSVALFDNGTVAAHDHRVLGRGHAEALVPMIAQLPDKGWAQRILVSLGPGSFTGTRIGIAAARALGFAWGAQVLGYPTPALVALAAMQPDARAVTVCMNGGHGEWFMQNFSAQALAENTVQSLRPEDAARALVHDVIAGNRAAECAQLFDDKKIALDLLPDARHAIFLGDSMLTANLAPVYGRAPDAKPQQPAGPAS